MWEREFKSQTYNQPCFKHKSLPVYETQEFDFYRCVTFDESLYYKTASELHHGNLRKSNGRFSKLFPGQKLSYWANSPKTAFAEIKKHGATDDYLLFWAYDDASSFVPIKPDPSFLTIIDGRKTGIQEIIDKVENDIEITESEKQTMKEIMDCEPDCLAYDSYAVEGGENFIFFEKGFQKLSLREVRLNLNNRKPRRKNVIVCADTSDYHPYIEEYGDYFAPIVRIKRDPKYLKSQEFQEMQKRYDDFFEEYYRNR